MAHHEIPHFGSHRFAPTGLTLPLILTLTLNRRGRARFVHRNRLLLAAHLQNFPVAIGVQLLRISRAKGRPVLGKEPAGLEPDAASVAQRFRTKWAGSPLRCFDDLAVGTPTARNRSAVRLGFPLLLLGRRFFHAGEPLGVVNRAREHESGDGGGAVRRRRGGGVRGAQRRRREIPRQADEPRPLAPRLHRNRNREIRSLYSLRRPLNRLRPVRRKRSGLRRETSGGAQ